MFYDDSLTEMCIELSLPLVEAGVGDRAMKFIVNGIASHQTSTRQEKLNRLDHIRARTANDPSYSETHKAADEHHRRISAEPVYEGHPSYSERRATA